MKKFINKLIVLLLAISIVMPNMVFALEESETTIGDTTTTGEVIEKETKIIEYTNPNTKYRVVIQDEADLLTPEEEERLKDTMIGITEYGHVGFVTINKNEHYTASSYARYYSHQVFGSYVSSTVFLIDMDTRNIYLFNNGDIEKKISANKSEVITDNTFRYASNADYYKCANETFRQVNTVLNGGKINEPMKHISNFVMSIAISVLLGYIIVSGATKIKKQIVTKNYASTFALANANATYIGDHTVYCPPSSSSGGSSSGGGGGGGGGGSGGGHGF
jgi:uncharacterized protein